VPPEPEEEENGEYYIL